MPRSTTEMETDLEKGFVSKRKLMNMKTRGEHTSGSEHELTSEASADWLASSLCCAERQYNSYNILAGSRRPLCNVRGVLNPSTLMDAG